MSGAVSYQAGRAEPRDGALCGYVVILVEASVAYRCCLANGLTAGRKQEGIITSCAG